MSLKKIVKKIERVSKALEKGLKAARKAWQEEKDISLDTLKEICNENVFFASKPINKLSSKEDLFIDKSITVLSDKCKVSDYNNFSYPDLNR